MFLLNVITADVLLQASYICRKKSNFIFVMIIKNTASPTTGLCTSQKALSWLSRIFRSILSLFLSTLGETRRAELFWQSWSRYEPLMLEQHSCCLLVCWVQTETYFACASACIKINSHFLAKARCSLAKLSCKQTSVKIREKAAESTQNHLLTTDTALT